MGAAGLAPSADANRDFTEGLLLGRTDVEEPVEPHTSSRAATSGVSEQSVSSPPLCRTLLWKAMSLPSTVLLRQRTASRFSRNRQPGLWVQQQVHSVSPSCLRFMPARVASKAAAGSAEWIEGQAAAGPA
jgi:hypothetical protein